MPSRTESGRHRPSKADLNRFLRAIHQRWVTLGLSSRRIQNRQPLRSNCISMWINLFHFQRILGDYSQSIFSRNENMENLFSTKSLILVFHVLNLTVPNEQ